MNRIAVIISGEYRTFDICRKTMTFLDNENVGVYFSTWDRTVQSNKYLNYHIDETVTINRIKSALGDKKAKGICLEKYE